MNRKNKTLLFLLLLFLLCLLLIKIEPALAYWTGVSGNYIPLYTPAFFFLALLSLFAGLYLLFPEAAKNIFTVLFSTVLIISVIETVFYFLNNKKNQTGKKHSNRMFLIKLRP